MKTVVSSFLRTHYDPARPVLLALSGGPDSLALLHLLQQLSPLYQLELAIAHVDHGWRSESAEEAAQLAQLAEKMGLPFHLKKLDPQVLKGNLESACRDERLGFFLELCRKHSYQAVILGHHADDLAETVLKRILEGAGLTHLSGPEEISSFHGMPLWRPLIKVRKQEIIDWLQVHHFRPFEDRTNQDPRFLRARMRQTLIPFLDQQFGKQTAPALAHLSREAIALHSYLRDRIRPHLDAIVSGKWGLLLDLTALPTLHSYELKELIRLFAEQGALTLSRDAVDTTASLLEKGAADKQINALHIDRCRLFLPNQPAIPMATLALTEGIHSIGTWTVKVSRTQGPITHRQGWRAVWEGRCSVTLPAGDYTLGTIPPQSPYRGSSPIDKWWTNHKVPAFMRSQIPGIWKDGDLIHEFLTDKTHYCENSASHINIALYYTEADSKPKTKF